MNKNPIAVLVEFDIVESEQDRFLAILLPHLRRVRQEETCVTLRVSRKSVTSSRFVLYEEWEDRDEFLSIQMSREYRIPYNAALEGLEATDRTVTVWDRIEY